MALLTTNLAIYNFKIKNSFIENNIIQFQKQGELIFTEHRLGQQEGGQINTERRFSISEMALQGTQNRKDLKGLLEFLPEDVHIGIVTPDYVLLEETDPFGKDDNAPLIPPPDVPIGNCSINAVKISGILDEGGRKIDNILNGEQILGEVQFNKGDGTYGYIGVAVTAIRNAIFDGMEYPLLFLCECRNISEEKLNQIALENEILARKKAEQEAQAQLAGFAGMSHEIRTPMNGVLGFVDLLLQDPCLTQEQREYIEQIRASGEHLLGLINGILDFAKGSAGKMEVNKNDFNLIETLELVIGMLTAQAQSKGLTLNLSQLTQIPDLVLGDSTKLIQILINLIGNAIKFTEAGSVTLEVNYQNGQCIFTVTDTGIGIPENRLGAIFEPFKQEEGGRRFGGTGLGLAISKQLTELMSGTIGVSSIEGQGTSFNISLPMPVTEDAIVVEQEVEQPDMLSNPELKKKFRILVADDNPVNLKLMTLLLEREGYTVIKASCGLGAIALYNQGCELVILDGRMPDMTGGEVAKHIKKSNPATPVYSYSGESGDEGFDGGDINGFFGKPFDRNHVLGEIGRHFMEFAKRKQQP